jgi:microcystin-dependent protein
VGQPFVGEIRMFGGTFAPAGWAFCAGQLLPISENETLFNLIGTTYGGDGQSTFAVPNLCGRVPVHAGQGPGLSQNYQIGEQAGVESVTLSTQQIPIHTHTLTASTNVAQDTSPAGKVLGQIGGGALPYIQDTTDTNLNANAVTPAGGSQPHENMQPYLCISFIISLFGVFPSQS